MISIFKLTEHIILYRAVWATTPWVGQAEPLKSRRDKSRCLRKIRLTMLI